MKNKLKRLVALIVVLAMCLSLLSANVWAVAEEQTGDDSTSAQSSEDASQGEEESVDEEPTHEDDAISSEQVSSTYDSGTSEEQIAGETSSPEEQPVSEDVETENGSTQSVDENEFPSSSLSHNSGDGESDGLLETQAINTNILVGKWSGNYNGTYNGQLVERKIMLDIDRSSADGKFEGIATIDNGTNGSYYFEGNINSITGEVEFVGKEWRNNPSNFGFASFVGKYENNQISGVNDGDQNRTFHISKISDNYTEYKIGENVFPRHWMGIYDGRSGSITVRRTIELQITDISNGAITGVATINPSKEAPDEYGVTGSYYFNGTYNSRISSISLQGYEWIQYPVGGNNSSFSFVRLSGCVDESGKKLIGTSEDGIWEMELIDDNGTNQNQPNPGSNSTFNQYIYHADFFLNNPSLSSFVESRMFESSPSKELYRVGQENGLASSATIWDGLTTALDAVNDPSKIPDDGLKKKDVYSGLIMSIFEASVDDNALDNINLEQAEFADSLYGFLKTNLLTEINIDLTKINNFSSLTQAQKEKLLSSTNEWLDKKTGLVGKGMDGISTGLKIFGYVKDINEYCKYVSSVCVIYEMNDSLKQTMRDLYETCPSSNQDLKLALLQCKNIIDSNWAVLITQLSAGGTLLVTKNVAQFGISKLWESAKSSAAASNPYIAVYWVAYSGSKSLCNALLSTDEICEQYFKMEAILQIESVLSNVYQKNRTAFLGDKTSVNAQTLISTADVMFQCFDVDCDTAYDFVNTADEVAFSKLLTLFGARDGTELKAQIKRIQRNVRKTHWVFSTSWATHLEADYPELADKYSYVYKHHISECDINYGPDSFVYTGYAMTLPIRIKYSDEEEFSGVDLVEGTDYRVEYSNNLNAGVATVTVTGIGYFYRGEEKHTFRIEPTNLSYVVVKPETGVVNETNLELSFGDYILKPGVDYKVTWEANSDKSTHTMKLTGIGNFTGERTARYTHAWDAGKVTRAATTTEDGIRTYTCTVCHATRTEPIAKLPAPKKQNNTITASNIVKSYSISAQSFKLGAKTQGGAKLSFKSNSNKVTVDKKGKVTIKAKFSGTAKITITAAATSSYNQTSKTITVTVPTVPSGLKVTASKGLMTVQWKQNNTGKGYEIQVSTKKNFKSNLKQWKISDKSTRQVRIKGIPKGNYYLRMRTVNGKAYSNWSSVKNVKISK